MGNTITINNGLKIYDIADQNGEVIGQFKINPTDAKMVERYKESIKRLEETKTQYSDKEDDLDIFVELQKIVSDELVYIVGNNSVNIFFEIMGAFSLQDGQYYYEKILEIIGGIINEEGLKEKQKMNQRIKKYAKRYQ